MNWGFVLQFRKKPFLSIIVPTVPGRTNRVKTMLSRLTLSQKRCPEIPVEIIVIDGGSIDDLQEICRTIAQYIPLKYIYVPINEFINAGYPRNIGFRVAEGDIFTMLDADYWPSENFIKGATNPFVVRQNEQLVSLDGSRNIVNNGYVIDSSKSSYCSTNGKQFAEAINEPLLNQTNAGKVILDVFDKTKIPMPKPPSHIWLWSAPRKNIVKMNGYDEKFVSGYSREDDSFFYRLMKSGLCRHRNEYNEFCCIHLWHPASQRSDKKNMLNETYYSKMGTNNPISIKRNESHEWGKLVKGSFSIINDVTREPVEHEQWIANGELEIKAYLEDPMWESVTELKEYGHK